MADMIETTKQTIKQSIYSVNDVALCMACVAFCLA